jgi:hypothetical protein
VTSKLPNSKSPGLDGLGYEIFSASRKTLDPILLEAFNYYFKYATTPTNWRKSIMKMLYKNKGNQHRCYQYRGIVLLNSHQDTREDTPKKIMTTHCRYNLPLTKPIWLHPKHQHNGGSVHSHHSYHDVKANAEQTYI